MSDEDPPPRYTGLGVVIAASVIHSALPMFGLFLIVKDHFQQNVFGPPDPKLDLLETGVLVANILLSVAVFCTVGFRLESQRQSIFWWLLILILLTASLWVNLFLFLKWRAFALDRDSFFEQLQVGSCAGCMFGFPEWVLLCPVIYLMRRKYPKNPASEDSH